MVVNSIICHASETRYYRSTLNTRLVLRGLDNYFYVWVSNLIKSLLCIQAMYCSFINKICGHSFIMQSLFCFVIADKILVLSIVNVWELLILQGYCTASSDHFVFLDNLESGEDLWFC